MDPTFDGDSSPEVDAVNDGIISVESSTPSSAGGSTW